MIYITVLVSILACVFTMCAVGLYFTLTFYFSNYSSCSNIMVLAIINVHFYFIKRNRLDVWEKRGKKEPRELYYDRVEQPWRGNNVVTIVR